MWYTVVYALKFNSNNTQDSIPVYIYIYRITLCDVNRLTSLCVHHWRLDCDCPPCSADVSSFLWHAHCGVTHTLFISFFQHPSPHKSYKTIAI